MSKESAYDELESQEDIEGRREKILAEVSRFDCEWRAEVVFQEESIDSELFAPIFRPERLFRS